MSKPETETKKITRGTIGIFGSPIDVAALNKEIVKQANLLGLDEDQKIPEIVAIGFITSGTKDQIDAANICYDYGCDSIAIAHDIGESSIKDDLARSHPDKIEVFSSDGLSIEDYAKKLLDQALKNKNPRRPSLVHGENSREDIEINLVTDKRNQSKRVGDRLINGGYQLLIKHRDQYSFIIGGAGPLASAEMAEKHAMAGIPFIHISANSAPGKHKFEMDEEHEPSYVPYYQNLLSFAENIGKKTKSIKSGEPGSIVAACNTAHRRWESFFTGHEKLTSKFIDIRTAVLAKLVHEINIILFGTSTTTGVATGKHNFTGTYQKYIQPFSDPLKDGYVAPFIVPSEQQQSVLMDAIFKIKAGKKAEAKSLILSVITELKKDYPDSKVVLGCTELPLAFSKQELLEGLIDPAECLVSMVKETLSRNAAEKEMRNKHHLSSSGSGSESGQSRDSDGKRRHASLSEEDIKRLEKKMSFQIKSNGDLTSIEIQAPEITHRELSQFINSKFTDSNFATAEINQTPQTSTASISGKPLSEDMKKWLSSKTL